MSKVTTHKETYNDPELGGDVRCEFVTAGFGMLAAVHYCPNGYVLIEQGCAGGQFFDCMAW